MSQRVDLSLFLKEWESLLNADGEIKRRLKPWHFWRNFMGGPVPYPGPGPYPPPNLAIDPSGWTKKRGYKSTILPGKEWIELTIPEKNVTFTIRCDEDLRFSIIMERARDPILKVIMPLDVFKEMITGKSSVIWCLSDPRCKISYKELGISDWTTLFEAFIIGVELLERKPEFWDFIEQW